MKPEQVLVSKIISCMLRTDEIIPLGGARRKAENINDGNGKLERKEDFNSSSYLRGGSATSILAVCSAGPAQTHQTVLLISCHLSSPWAYVACVSSVCINWHSLCTKHTTLLVTYPIWTLSLQQHHNSYHNYNLDCATLSARMMHSHNIFPLPYDRREITEKAFSFGLFFGQGVLHSGVPFN